MNCREAHEIPIPEVLEIIGISPVRRTSTGVWYHSPFGAKDRHPSLQVSNDGKAFHCWSSGQYGDIIDLAKMLSGTASVSGGLQWLANLCLGHGYEIHDEYSSANKKKKGTSGFVDVNLSALTSQTLYAYARSRGICPDIIAAYCIEVRYRLHDRLQPYPYYAIGWRNDSGGYELRNAYVKQSIAPKDITTIGDMTDCPYSVFEGFFDFLAAVQLGWFSPMEGTAIVLNSTALVERIIPCLQNNANEVRCYLDNDNAGRGATNVLIHSLSNVRDFSFFYQHNEDINDYLQEMILQ